MSILHTAKTKAIPHHNPVLLMIMNKILWVDCKLNMAAFLQPTKSTEVHAMQ